MRVLLITSFVFFSVFCPKVFADRENEPNLSLASQIFHYLDAIVYTQSSQTPEARNFLEQQRIGLRIVLIEALALEEDLQSIRVGLPELSADKMKVLISELQAAESAIRPPLIWGIIPRRMDHEQTLKLIRLRALRGMLSRLSKESTCQRVSAAFSIAQ